MERKALVGGGALAIGMVAGYTIGFLFYGAATVHCPTVKQYSRVFLDRAARELETLPEDSAIGTLLENYKIARDEARRCANTLS